jgi:hypothetical protein
MSKRALKRANRSRRPTNTGARARAFIGISPLQDELAHRLDLVRRFAVSEIGQDLSNASH